MGCSHLPLKHWPKFYSGRYCIYVAADPCLLMQGLQNHKKLSKYELVAFPNVPANTYFHTKNCLFSMDIIAIDASGTILQIWTAGPNRSKIGPVLPGVNYVIEAQAGWCQNNRIGVGTKLQFKREK